MFGKIRTDFQANVDNQADALHRLIKIVLQHVEAIRTEIERISEEDSEEYEEWDESSKSMVKMTWHPNYDTEFLDQILDSFYSALIIRVYSFAEQNLARLLDEPRAKSYVDLCYKSIEKKYKVKLEPIDSIWTNKEKLRNLRNNNAHVKIETGKHIVDFLHTSIQEIHELLLYVDKIISCKKQQHVNRI